MFSAVTWLLVAGVLGAAGGHDDVGSFLYQPAYAADEVLRAPAERYLPQPGDLVFCTDHKVFWCLTHSWAGAGHPHHSGIVLARPDGRLAVLEAGPHDTLWIRILDIGPHLQKYVDDGESVWIRRRRTPLTEEESARLTAFALSKDNHRFALIRQGAQLTPLRSRGTPVMYFLAKPHPDRTSYFCSELVVESLVVAGLLDTATARPAATYPSDLFFDRSKNPHLNAHLNLTCSWYPPARWTSCASTEAGSAAP